jgi:hypothetical protein
LIIGENSQTKSTFLQIHSTNISNRITKDNDNDTLEEGEEKEDDDDNVIDMDGGVLEADGVNYDSDNEDWNDYNHGTDHIDANVLNNDESEGRIKSIRRKVVPARLKECMF